MARARWSAVWTVAALGLLWAALVVPYRPADLQPAALVRLPLEGLVLLALVLVVPERAVRAVAVVAGLALAGLCLLKVLDLGFRLALDRPFDAVGDATYAESAKDLLFDVVGPAWAVVSLATAALLILALVVLLPLAARRLGAVASGHQRGTARATVALLAAWTVLAVSGASLGGGTIASTSAAGLVVDQARQVREGIRDQERFLRSLGADPLPAAAAPGPLSGLRGKDVLVVFVESYGRFALEGAQADPVTTLLEESTRDLQQAGFDSRSGFLTSPTSGGVSWLAHATLQSGLWVDSQDRYERLLDSDRIPLMGLFRRAGWRTVMDIPSTKAAWPEGERFYDFHVMYGRDDVGYAGPRFGFSKLPDQFALEALQRQELARPGRGPLMAQVDLASSHAPWAQVPRLIPWEDLGDGTIFEQMSRATATSWVWTDRTRMAEAYVDSLVYTLSALTEFILRYGDDDLVLVVLGDHQPNAYVTGPGAGHDVPVSVISRDPAVLTAIDGWEWQAGLHPGPGAPVWRMDAFLDRFLDAYGAASRPRAEG